MNCGNPSNFDNSGLNLTDGDCDGDEDDDDEEEEEEVEEECEVCADELSFVSTSALLQLVFNVMDAEGRFV